MSSYLQDLYKNVRLTIKSEKGFFEKQTQLSKGTLRNLRISVKHFKVIMNLKGTSANDVILELQQIDDDARRYVV